MLEGHEDVLRKLESDMEKAAEADDLVKAAELQTQLKEWLRSPAEKAAKDGLQFRLSS